MGANDARTKEAISMKLTKKQREQIVDLYASGEDIHLIASLFGVSRKYPSTLAARYGKFRPKFYKCPKCGNNIRSDLVEILSDQPRGKQ